MANSLAKVTRLTHMFFKYVWQHKSSHNINIDQICPHLMNDNLHQYSYKGAFLDSLGRDYYVIGTASDIQVNTQYLKVSNHSWRIHRTFRLPDECRPHQSDCVQIVDSKTIVNSHQTTLIQKIFRIFIKKRDH